MASTTGRWPGSSTSATPRCERTFARSSPNWGRTLVSRRSPRQLSWASGARSWPLVQCCDFGWPCNFGVIDEVARARSDDRRGGRGLLLSQADVAIQHAGHHAGLNRFQVRLCYVTAGRDTKGHKPLVVAYDVDHGLLLGGRIRHGRAPCRHSLSCPVGEDLVGDDPRVRAVCMHPVDGRQLHVIGAEHVFQFLDHGPHRRGLREARSGEMAGPAKIAAPVRQHGTWCLVLMYILVRFVGNPLSAGRAGGRARAAPRTRSAWRSTSPLRPVLGWRAQPLTPWHWG